MRVWILLVSVAVLAGCGAAETPTSERPTPLNWVPLDKAGTTACAIARESVEHGAGHDATVVAAIAEVAQRSTVPGVRWQGEHLGATEPESDITNYYNSCVSGGWQVPGRDADD